MGQIRQSKGLKEIVQAGERFGVGITLDIYGTLDFDVPQETFHGLNRVRYCGVVSPEHVIQVLKKYDVLLLPTFYAGEGYPGVILEAYSAGLPVICTRWQALPEIVDDSSGILIEPHNVDALFEAMQRLINSEELYNRLVAGVKIKRQTYSSQIWVEKFIELCRKAEL